MRKVYECVRVFDISQSVRLSVGEDGSLTECGNEDNYTSAGRTGVYERALMTKGRASEVAFRGNDLLYVTAVYAQCRDKSYVIEVISTMENDGLGGVYNKTEIIARIDSCGVKKDAVVRTENLREEDMKNVAEIVTRRIRTSDMVVRKENDEYVMILKNVGEEHFQKATRNIYGDLRAAGLNVRIGACRALGKIADLTKSAEDNAERAKETDGICIDSSAFKK